MADRTLRIVFAGDASRAIAASRGLQSNLQKLGTSMTNAGRTMTRTISLPIVAAAGASLKLATDFETAFTRIDAVSNASEKNIKKWRTEVLKLSGQTARAPEELADALYFLSSAGLKTNQIMPTLAMSAKAAASGLGLTSDIARLTANALNAYAKEGLTAAQVTDTLAAAVKEGTAEPEEFANALGRILPAAQKAGVGFDEVTASLASLSNIGLDVNEGVTAMRGLMLALLAPGKQAADTLKELGLTADEVRDTMANDGILAVLRLLEDRTNGNIDTIKKAIPNVRALAGLFGITGQEAKKVDASFKAVAGSTGSLDKMFEETQKSSGYKFQKLLVQLKKLGIELGNILLPFARKAAREIGKLAKAFSGLSDGAKKWILISAGVLAALGPMLRMFGALVKGIALVRLAIIALSSNHVVAACIALSTVVVLLVNNWDKVRPAIARAFKGVGAFFDMALGPLDEFIAGLIRAIGLLQQLDVLNSTQRFAQGFVDTYNGATQGSGGNTSGGKSGGAMGATRNSRGVVVNINGGNLAEVENTVRRVMRQEFKYEGRTSRARLATP